MRKIISIMAGHSRWANVKHRKERADAKRGKVFTRLIREITVAARLGGGDPAGNPRLRLALEKAREQNLPGDNIQRAIQRGSGELDGTAYEEIRYEGYGPGGAAVMLDCLTDNRTGAVDVFTNDDDSVELVCAPPDFTAVKAALAKAGLKPELAEITMKPTMENPLAGDEAARM